MAAQSWRLLASLSRPERAALLVIRRSFTAPAGDSVADARFGVLAALCRDRALRIAQPESAFVTGDERLLLAGLAAQQRQSVAANDFTCPRLANALADGATMLAAIGIRPLFNGARTALLREHGWVASPRKPCAATDADGFGYPRPGTAKWAVVEHARGRDTVSSAELQALGVTRQYISLLSRNGVLERVTFGHYRLGSMAAGRR